MRIELGIIERTRIAQVHVAKRAVSEDVDRAGQSEVAPCHLWNILDIRRASQWLEKGISCTLQKRPKYSPRSYKADWLPFRPWENKGCSCGCSWNTFLGTRRRKWLGTISMDLSKVNHAWLAWLPSMVKWLNLWMREEQWISFTLTLARLSTLSPMIFLYPDLDMTVWVDQELDD